MAKARAYGNDVRVVVVAAGDVQFYHAGRVITARERAAELASALSVLKVADYRILFNAESYMDTMPLRDVVTAIENEISLYKPTMVLLPYPSFHQDHKVVFEACFAALRPSPEAIVPFVAMYEYPFVAWNYEHLNGGKTYVDITDYMELKVKALLQHSSQVRQGRHLISPDTIVQWAANRGLEISTPYAELYHVLRYIV